MTAHRSLLNKGLLAALGAHAIWGSMPLYLILVRKVPVFEFVAWRTLFTLPVCLAAIGWSGTWPQLRGVLGDGRAMRTLLGSAAMIAVNWCLYVWAIQSGHIYAASLGYYILPLVMMLLGLVVLGERLTRLQWAAVALAGTGVAALAAGALTTLWVSLSMAITFAVYGLLRKTVAAGPVVGLAVESLLLLPVAVGIVVWYAAGHGGATQGSAFGRNTLETMAIILGGPMTAVPLILFAMAARAMPYTVIGFLQFISPTIVFVLGLTVFGEGAAAGAIRLLRGDLGRGGGVHLGAVARAPASRRRRARLARGGGLAGEAPGQRLARMERDDAGARGVYRRRHLDGATFQGHGFLVERQAIKARPVLAGEGLEPLERAFLLEHRQIAFQREGRIEDAGAAAGRFLGLARMRRAVGAEEVPGRARCRGAAQRQPMPLALGDRQAVGMRADPPPPAWRCG